MAKVIYNRKIQLKKKKIKNELKKGEPKFRDVGESELKSSVENPRAP